MGNENQFLTIEQLCFKLKVKESWVRSQVFNKTIPFFKVGRFIRFDLNEINQWLESNKQGEI